MIVIVLNSFRYYAIGVSSTFFELNNFFIRCTLLLADGFSYMLGKPFITSIVVFSFITLCATNLNRVNRITPSTCLSRRFHHSSFIVSSFFPKRGRPKEIIFYLHPPMPKVCSIKLLKLRINSLLLNQL